MYPLSKENDEGYKNLLLSAIMSNNSKLLEYLLSLQIHNLVDFYYELLATALYQKNDLEIIKFLLDYVKTYNPKDHHEIEGEFVSLACVAGSKEVKKYIETLESYN